MDTLSLMKMRHSVRQYTEQKIEGEILEKLQAQLISAEEKSGLDLSLY